MEKYASIASLVRESAAPVDQATLAVALARLFPTYERPDERVRQFFFEVRNRERDGKLPYGGDIIGLGPKDLAGATAFLWVLARPVPVGFDARPSAESNPVSPWDTFTISARALTSSPMFDRDERSYKLQIAERVQRARLALSEGKTDWFGLVLDALRNKQNNLINWRVLDAFQDWCNASPAAASEAARSLWDDATGLQARIDQFVSRTSMKGIDSILSIVSVLLMGLGPHQYPPYRVSVLERAYDLTGTPRPASSSGSARFGHALSFFDTVMIETSRRGLRLRDRLDAQSVVYAIVSPKPETERTPDGRKAEGANSITNDKSNEDTTAIEDAQQRQLEENLELSDTEKQALITARRGQGQFRTRVMGIERRCRVTGISDPAFLIASHIKPWRSCDSAAERLDGSNGLLLAPHVDYLFDRGFISFSDDGEILISSLVDTEHRKRFGLDPTRKVGSFSAAQRGYLTYHRSQIFGGPRNGS